MIVNVRGALGSGKSTLVRTIVQDRDMRPVYDEGSRRRVPVGMIDGSGLLFVAGHYSRPTMGGMDSFRTLDQAWREVRSRLGTSDVLCEGKCQSRDEMKLIELSRHTRVVCVTLSTPSDDCVLSVRGRATANAIREELIRASWRKAMRDHDVLARNGIECYLLDRTNAIARVRELIS